MAKADAVVAMTMTARERLAAGYAVDMRKVCIIAHGAPALQAMMAEPTFRTGPGGAGSEPDHRHVGA
jgi:hypothetical protein